MQTKLFLKIHVAPARIPYRLPLIFFFFFRVSENKFFHVKKKKFKNFDDFGTCGTAIMWFFMCPMSHFPNIFSKNLKTCGTSGTHGDRPLDHCLCRRNPNTAIRKSLSLFPKNKFVLILSGNNKKRRGN